MIFKRISRKNFFLLNIYSDPLWKWLINHYSDASVEARERGGASEVNKIEKPHCSGEYETLIWCDLYQIRNKSNYNISKLSWN